MERIIKKSDENNIVNSDNKVWVTISYNCNLGNYESYKMEVGFSQTLRPLQNPFDLMNVMIQDIDDTVIEHVENTRKELSNKIPRR